MNLHVCRGMSQKYWDLINRGKRLWETNVLPDVQAFAVMRDGRSFADDDVFVFAKVRDRNRNVHTYAYLARTYDGKVCTSRSRFVRRNILGTTGWEKALRSLDKYLTVLEVMHS